MAEPKQDQQQRQSDAKLIVAIAGALAIGASAQQTAAALASVVGLPISVLLPVLRIAMSRPMVYGPPIPSELNTAVSEASRLEPTFRAAYVLNASRRLQAGLKDGGSLRGILDYERGYFQQHLDAVANRLKAAKAVDAAAKRFGPDLGWYATLDNRTSPECRQANGKNFSVTQIPAIGWPGSVHLHCRCKAGKPHKTSQSVYSIKTIRKAS